jgi:hypothetical protein
MRTLMMPLLCLTTSMAAAAEYGHYDVKKVLSLSEATPGNNK